MKQKKYASREGTAAYGYKGYLKVSSVMVITPMLDLGSGYRHEKRKPGGQRDFERILADKSEQLKENGSIEGAPIGYTRSGQLYVSQPASRTYC